MVIVGLVLPKTSGQSRSYVEAASSERGESLKFKFVSLRKSKAKFIYRVYSLWEYLHGINRMDTHIHFVYLYNILEICQESNMFIFFSDSVLRLLAQVIKVYINALEYFKGPLVPQLPFILLCAKENYKLHVSLRNYVCRKFHESVRNIYSGCIA